MGVSGVASDEDDGGVGCVCGHGNDGDEIFDVKYEGKSKARMPFGIAPLGVGAYLRGMARAMPAFGRHTPCGAGYVALRHTPRQIAPKGASVPLS